MNDLIFSLENGINQTIIKGTSITFLILSNFVNKIFEDPLLSLRISSLFSAILFFISVIYIERKFFKLSNIYRNVAYISIVYVLVLQSFLFIGINDLLLNLFTSFIFIFLFYEIKKSNFDNKSKINYLLIGVFLGLMLCTRRMSLVYIPSFFIIILVSNFGNFNFLIRKSVYLVLGFSLILFSLNLPSLKENNKFSFDDKVLNHEINWAQWDYYNILKIHEGAGVRRKHVDINDVKDYLIENGKESLPKTFFGMIFFDIEITLIEFYNGLSDSFFGFLRSLGLLFLFGLIYLLFKVKDFKYYKLKKHSNIVILFAISFTLIISFIVISFIQFRWFMVFIPLLIISLLNKLEEIEGYASFKLFFLFSHLLILFIMNLPFLINHYN